MFTNQIDSPVPEWSRFVSDDLRMVIRTTDVPGIWGVEFGRFQGTSPDSGTTHDTDTLTGTSPADHPGR